ncbi:MAG: arginine repressor [Candidatus Aminicenantes bacterium]|nr:arginine repressor [Candidatus Aminicenantes bacterium]
MNNNTKIRRHRLLKEIVVERGIGDQRHMQKELKKKGIQTTQATISRDLQAIGFVKVRSGPGRYKYELLERAPEDVVWDRLRLLFRNFVVEIRSTKNLILIRTSPGNAHGVASLIDHVARPEVLGTVAGDDTILVVVDSDRNRAGVEDAFRRLL